MKWKIIGAVACMFASFTCAMAAAWSCGGANFPTWWSPVATVYGVMLAVIAAIGAFVFGMSALNSGTNP